MDPKMVFVSGCYDLLYSGHIEYGDLYVGIGSNQKGREISCVSALFK